MSTAGFDELCEQARQAVGAGNYKEGRDLYAQAVAASGESPDAHYGLATCCFLLNDFDEALQHFLEVTRLDPQRATAFINLGALYNRLGQQEEAIKNLRKGLQLDPRRAEGYYNLGIAYRQKGLSDLAIQAYREATRLNPRMADAFLNLGNLLFETGRFSDSIAAYQHAVSVRPNFEKAMVGLKNAEKALAGVTPAAKTAARPEPSTHIEIHQRTEVDFAPGFSNVVERAEAIEELRDVCLRQEELCREIVRVIEHELSLALRDLSRSLLGDAASGELELH